MACGKYLVLASFTLLLLQKTGEHKCRGEFPFQKDPFTHPGSIPWPRALSLSGVHWQPLRFSSSGKGRREILARPLEDRSAPDLQTFYDLPNQQGMFWHLLFLSPNACPSFWAVYCLFLWIHLPLFSYSALGSRMLTCGLFFPLWFDFNQ